MVDDILVLKTGGNADEALTTRDVEAEGRPRQWQRHASAPRRHAVSRLAVQWWRSPRPLGGGRGRQRQCLDLQLRDAEEPDHATMRRRAPRIVRPASRPAIQIAPPGGYVGGGLQLQTDIAVDPAGDVWAMNNWQDLDSCFGISQRGAFDALRRAGCDDFLRHGQAGRTPQIGPARPCVPQTPRRCSIRYPPSSMERVMTIRSRMRWMAAAAWGAALLMANPSASAEMSATELAKLAQNPVGNLISVPFQNNTNLNFGPDKKTQNILNIQPVIPVSMNEDWNVITRTILPVISQPVARSGQLAPARHRRHDLTAFVSPANRVSWIWGVGSVLANADATTTRNSATRTGARFRRSWCCTSRKATLGSTASW